MAPRPYPLVVKLYLNADRYVNSLFWLLKGCFVGFWLGVFDKETLHGIDQYYYDQAQKYVQARYNRMGLWKWEKEMLNWYFWDCRTLLVAGVGGGREVFALHQLGYVVEGFECNPRLVAYANEFLRSEGVPAQIWLAPRDDCPPLTQTYDGLIVGWGAYMLIQGRRNRIAFLRKLRALVRPQGPILLSCFTRPGDLIYFRVIALVACPIRRLRRREPVELGDALAPNYVHYFTKHELAQELHEGGFELVYYGADDYGHAVGMAAPD